MAASSACVRLFALSVFCLKALSEGSASLAVVLLVKMPEIDVIHHPDGYDREGEDLSAGFQVTCNHLVRRGERHMRMKPAINDVPVHAHQVRRLGGILHE